MRLATILVDQQPRAVVLKDPYYFELHANNPNLPNSVRGFLELTESEQKAGIEQVFARKNPERHHRVLVQYQAPIMDPRKIVCVGLNYKDHAAESGLPIPKEPVLFSKYPTALIGHNASIELPSCSSKVDYEAELVIVIGKKGRHLTEVQAAAAIAGSGSRTPRDRSCGPTRARAHGHPRGVRAGRSVRRSRGTRCARRRRPAAR